MPVKIHQNTAAHWALRTVWAAATIAFLLYVPMKTETSTIQELTQALQYGIAAMSLNLVMGYGGIISLGHSAYFGLGGYTTAVLIDHYGWPQGWTLYIAAIFGFVAGCLTSLPALRLKGVYLALVTLGLAVLFPQLVRWNKLEWLTDGALGINDIGYDDVPTWPVLGELERVDGRTVFLWWMTVIVLVLGYLVCRGIVKSRVGRSLIAIRDNETAAAVMGVNRARTKMLVFGLSAAMCAVGGSVFALSAGQVSPELPQFTLIGAITFVLIMVVGGAATLWGPTLGAIAYVWVATKTREAGDEDSGVIGWLFGWMSGSPASLILAITLLVMIFVAPFGIVGLLKRLAAKFVVIVPAPAGTGSNVPPIEEGVAPSADEPFLPITTGDTP